MPNAIWAEAAALLKKRQQQRRAIQHCPRVPHRSVTASDDTCGIEIKCAFLGPTATLCCSCMKSNGASRINTLHSDTLTRHVLSDFWFTWVNRDSCYYYGGHWSAPTMLYGDHLTFSLMTFITSAEEGDYVFSSVCLSFCLSVLLKKLWMDFDEIFWRGRAWPKEQWVQFWWWSGSLSGSRSPKSGFTGFWRSAEGLCSLSTSSFLYFSSAYNLRARFVDSHQTWHIFHVGLDPNL